MGFESGTHAALAGGTTMVVDLVIPEKEGSLLDAFQTWREAADEKSCCDYSLCVWITSVTDQTLDEMETLSKEHGPVRRACVLAKLAGTPIVISNPTSAAAIEVIKEFKEKGASVMGEPSIAPLCVDGEHYYNKCYNHAANFVSSPPLRDDEDTKEQLLDAVVDGTFDMVSSSHCARDKSETQDCFTDIPEGMVGVEERLSLLYASGVETGEMELTQFVNVTSTAAAKLLNIYPRKGCIAEGSDADIVVLDPAANLTISHKSHHSNTDFNIFEDQTVTAGPEFVVAGGKIVVAEFQTNASPGSAVFVECSAFPGDVYENISEDKPKKVDRVELPSDTIDGTTHAQANGFGLTCPRGFKAQQVMNKQLGIYQRPLSAHGVRNQQDSSFSLNG